MIPELVIGTGIGAAAVVGGIAANRRVDTWKKQLAARWGVDNRNAEEQAIGRLALATLRAFGPDLNNLNARIAKLDARIASIEEHIAALDCHPREKSDHPPDGPPTGATPESNLTSKMGPPVEPEPDPESWKSKLRTAATAWDWKTDSSVFAMARDLHAYLMGNGIKKKDAEERVRKVMEAHARPGVEFAELFRMVVSR